MTRNEKGKEVNNNMCSNCGGKITQAAINFCRSKGVKPLCYDCQKIKGIYHGNGGYKTGITGHNNIPRKVLSSDEWRNHFQRLINEKDFTTANKQVKLFLDTEEKGFSVELAKEIKQLIDKAYYDYIESQY